MRCARNEQIMFLIGETAGPQERNSGIKTGCFPKGLSANVVLSEVPGSLNKMHSPSFHKKVPYLVFV